MALSTIKNTENDWLSFVVRGREVKKSFIHQVTITVDLEEQLSATILPARDLILSLIFNCYLKSSLFYFYFYFFCGKQF